MGWLEEHEERTRAAELAKAQIATNGQNALADAMELSVSNDIETLNERCQRRVLTDCLPIIELAKKSGDPISKGFSIERIDCTIKLNPTEPGMALGSISVHYLNKTIQRNFSTPVDLEAPKRCSMQAMRAMMQGHDWFCEGLDHQAVDEVTDPQEGDDDMVRVNWFAKNLDRAGSVGFTFKKILTEEGHYNHLRWLAKAHLEDMIKSCAKNGLLPDAFDRSRLHLEDGMPGEPLLLMRWGVPPRVSFSYNSEDDILKAYPEKPHGPDEEVAWTLPSLDKGNDAIWNAMCIKIAHAHAAGWPDIPSHYASSDFKAKTRSTIERHAIAKHAVASESETSSTVSRRI